MFYLVGIGHSYPMETTFFSCTHLLILYTMFIMPIFAFALAIPIVRMQDPFILFSTKPKICSTLALTLDFFRLDSFWTSVSGLFLYPFSLTLSTTFFWA